MSFTDKTKAIFEQKGIHMKKILAILLAVMMLFVLVSCGKDKNNKPSETTNPSSVTATKQKKTAGTTDSEMKEKTEGEIITDISSEMSKTDQDKQQTTTDKPTEPSKPAGNTDTGQTNSVQTDTAKTDVDKPDVIIPINPGKKSGSNIIELPIIDPNVE